MVIYFKTPRAQHRVNIKKVPSKVKTVKQKDLSKTQRTNFNKKNFTLKILEVGSQNVKCLQITGLNDD